MSEVNTYVQPSKIHGLGLFASRDIDEGEEIFLGKADYDRDREAWIEYRKKNRKPSMNFALDYCMMNHSKTPNTKRSGKKKIIATQPIKERQEITEDYYALPEDQNPFISPEYWMMEAMWNVRSQRRVGKSLLL